MGKGVKTSKKQYNKVKAPTIKWSAWIYPKY